MRISEYYDSMTPDEWKSILGSNLNYHFGFYKRGMGFEEGLRFATRRLLPLFSGGRRVLDLGCGWGGPALDLVTAGYDPVCITNSEAQYSYCHSLGLVTVLSDVEDDDLAHLGYFDTVFMMESLEHIFDKQRLLWQLGYITSRLVFVTTTSSLAVDSPLSAFGGTICMISPSTLFGMLEKAGWRVLVTADVRKCSMPTFIHWKARIEAGYPVGMTPAVRILYDLCVAALEDKSSFERTFPLVMVCAQLAQ